MKSPHSVPFPKPFIARPEAIPNVSFVRRRVKPSVKASTSRSLPSSSAISGGGALSSAHVRSRPQYSTPVRCHYYSLSYFCFHFTSLTLGCASLPLWPAPYPVLCQLFLVHAIRVQIQPHEQRTQAHPLLQLTLEVHHDCTSTTVGPNSNPGNDALALDQVASGWISSSAFCAGLSPHTRSRNCTQPRLRYPC